MTKTQKDPTKAMTDYRSFNGDLSLVSAVNLFQLIKLAFLSGRLVVNCEDNSTHFIFTEGKLNYAFSRQGRKKIGQTLLESQLITNDQLKSCLEVQKAADRWQKLGSIFVKNGYLKQSHLTEIFHKQHHQTVFLQLELLPKCKVAAIGQIRDGAVEFARHTKAIFRMI